MLARTGLILRNEIRVRGVVQGVGFRPFVYRLAVRHGLRGFVRNESGGVLIEAEGEADALGEFLRTLEHPPLPHAKIADLSCELVPLRGESAFTIEPSLARAASEPSVTPDVATCDDCLREIQDPSDRRRGYAFTACTACGPRFTVVTDAPYDRDRTTMAPFPLCAACRTEYERPDDRRYHAESTACPACGPRLRLTTPAGVGIDTPDPLAETARRLLAGGIVAVKGLGGVHLACDAENDIAVRELRRRKGRDEKPFAVLMADLGSARRCCDVSPEEAALLESPARPIVLLRSRTPRTLAPSVAPGTSRLGVMLPYTPLHHLLARSLEGRPIVLTSGNVSDEPMAVADDEALRRLGAIADAFLTHDRRIEMRCDDSVARVSAGAPMILRRSRGYAPAAVDLPFRIAAPVLALGGAMKSVFAIGRGAEAILSHHVGDLDHYEAWRTYTDSIARYERLFQVAPEVLVHDLHPDYPSTGYAVERAAREGLRRIAVQHHHAHLASCMAENGLDGDVIGATFDGTGYGTDGTVWGGEFLIGGYRGFRRAAHFAPVAMPGGERAIREPWRMALSCLVHAGASADLLEGRIAARDLELVRRQLDRGLNAPRTSSCGRLFDAVASLAGVRDRVTYEGQAAIELEGLAAESASRGGYPVEFRREDDRWLIQIAPIVSEVASERRRGVPAGDIARRFHSTLVEAIRQTCRRLRDESGLDRVVLSGGVFMNEILLVESLAALGADGFSVFRHHRVPPNDGGLCLGQLAVASAGGGR